jgi:anaerobic ribonucleoside-triphosphate reductase activating protein
MEREEIDTGLSDEVMLNCAGFLPRSSVNGPGVRAVLWVQGCPIHCEGCFNPQFWDFSRADYIPVSSLAERILSVSKIDGVTFSGGEPFAQAHALALLGETLHHHGLSIVTYTGYTYAQVIAGDNPSWQHLLAETDLLIAGPYVPALSCARPYIGSANQEVIRLSDRISPVPDMPEEESAEVEFTIDPEGTLTATGFPDVRLIQAFAACQRER